MSSLIDWSILELNVMSEGSDQVCIGSGNSRFERKKEVMETKKPAREEISWQNNKKCKPSRNTKEIE
jgi:hypothetical protein